MALRLDPQKTRITIRTFARGLLSPLAHDLEIAARNPTGEGEAGDHPHARLRIPLGDLSVVGVVKRGKLETSVLSDSDRREIERRIREEIFGNASTLEVEASVENGRASLTFRAPKGAPTERYPVSIETTPDGATVKGAGELKLSSLGIGTIKGPMGVFKIDDNIEISFDATFVKG
jgi:hypothetical protein